MYVFSTEFFSPQLLHNFDYNVLYAVSYYKAKKVALGDQLMYFVFDHNRVLMFRNERHLVQKALWRFFIHIAEQQLHNCPGFKWLF